MTFVKTNWLSLIILGLIIFLFFNRNPFGCNKPSEPTVVTKTDTTILVIPQPVQQAPVSNPGVTIVQVPTSLPQQYQPSKDYEALLKQYNELAAKHLTVNTYKDSLTLKDSSGNRVGVFNYNDIVNENQIKSRQPNYQLYLKERTITNTTTITQSAIPKNKFYVMGEVTGSPNQIVNGAQLGLMWQNKKDQIYYIKGGGLSTMGTLQPQLSVGTAWKIKIGK